MKDEDLVTTAEMPREQGATPRPKTITVDYDTWLTAVELSQHNVDLGACLTRIVRDLPTQRDWLDPDVERWARQLTNTPALTESPVPGVRQPSKGLRAAIADMNAQPDVSGKDSARLTEFCRMTAVEVKATGSVAAATSLEMIGYMRELEWQLHAHDALVAALRTERDQLTALAEHYAGNKMFQLGNGAVARFVAHIPARVVEINAALKAAESALTETEPNQ